MNCPSSVVGVTDHLKSTFALFQHFLPRFFDKAVEVYEEMEQKEGDAFNENVGCHGIWKVIYSQGTKSNFL